MVSELTIWLWLNACFRALFDSELQSCSCCKIRVLQPDFSIALHMNIDLKCKYVDIHRKLKFCLNIYWCIASFPEQESRASHTSRTGLLSCGVHDLLEAIVMSNARLAALQAWLVMGTVMPPTIVSSCFLWTAGDSTVKQCPNPMTHWS